MNEELYQEIGKYAKEVGDVIAEENPTVVALYMKLFTQYITEILPMCLAMAMQDLTIEIDDTVRAYELMLNTVIDLKEIKGEYNENKNTGPS